MKCQYAKQPLKISDMATTLLNSSFKVKVESVDSHEGILPEAGAILFHAGDNTLIYGDGFNWLNISPGTQKSALALALTAIVINSLVGGVESTQRKFFNTVPYNLQSGFTPAAVPNPGDTITINEDMTFDWSSVFTITSTVANHNVNIWINRNGVRIPGVGLVVRMGAANTPVQAYGLGSLPAVVGDIITVTFETPVTTTLILWTANTGLHEQTD